MLFCITCARFERRDTSNQALYLGRCAQEEISVLICKPENGIKEVCGAYKQAPDAAERIAHYKAWFALHPPKEYKYTPGTQVGKDERPKAARRPRKKAKGQR